MKKKRFTEEQIIQVLKEVEVGGRCQCRSRIPHFLRLKIPQFSQKKRFHALAKNMASPEAI